MASDSTSTSRGFQSSSSQFQMESSSSSSFAASSSTQVVSQTETKSAKSIGEYHQINYYFLPSNPVANHIVFRKESVCLLIFLNRVNNSADWQTIAILHGYLID